MHAPRVAGAPLPDNVKAPSIADTMMADPPGAHQMSLLSIPELVGDEIQKWMEREREQRPGTTAGMLLHLLARRLGLQNQRQVYRYMSGEPPFPVEKLIVLCRTLNSWKLLQTLNQEAGLVAEPKPDVGKLDGFDLII